MHTCRRMYKGRTVTSDTAGTVLSSNNVFVIIRRRVDIRDKRCTCKYCSFRRCVQKFIRSPLIMLLSTLYCAVKTRVTQFSPRYLLNPIWKLKYILRLI